eukprot:scaffold2557_cov121-Cylindrotheca_fusiformis.AAC.37
MDAVMNQLEDEAGRDLDLRQLEGLLMRCLKLSQVLVAKVQEKQVKESRKQPNTLDPSPSRNSAHIPIPPEVLRQITPFLTAREMGRFFLLTSPHIATLLGMDKVWKDICTKLWPDCTSPNKAMIRDGDYQWYFRQRQKPITLEQDQLLQSLPPPNLQPDDLTLCLDIYSGSNELVCTKTIDNSHNQVSEFVQAGSITLHLESLINVGALPLQSGCHCWNLPKSYPKWRARLHMFVHQDQEMKRGHTLLDTSFSVWRGFSENGELTFLQRVRTKGLHLTDRGQYLQHRIVTGARKTPNWRNFLGVQSKVILICEKVEDPMIESDLQRFCFTKVRLEAIRLHENSAGNVQHNLFRHDPGWKTHGVELLHLLEELI